MQTSDPLADPTAQLAAVLRWYADMGVDFAVDDAPHDRFAEAATTAARPAVEVVTAPAGLDDGEPPSPVAPPADGCEWPALARPQLQAPALRPGVASADAALLSAQAAAQSARELAEAAPTLEALRAAVETFDGCALKRTASRLVFADGNPKARIMLVGEAPGADEDRQGLPFVGRAGQLLDKMLAAIGLDRTQVYIANVVPWRPPGNRTPTAQETAVCLPFIRRQIALAGPDLLVGMGGQAAQALFGIKEGITRVRGTWYEYEIEGSADGLRKILALATLHPAYLLRTASAKRDAWRDLRALRKALDALPPRQPA